MSLWWKLYLGHGQFLGIRSSLLGNRLSTLYRSSFFVVWCWPVLWTLGHSCILSVVLEFVSYQLVLLGWWGLMTCVLSVRFPGSFHKPELYYSIDVFHNYSHQSVGLLYSSSFLPTLSPGLPLASWWCSSGLPFGLFQSCQWLWLQSPGYSYFPFSSLYYTVMWLNVGSFLLQ